MANNMTQGMQGMQTPPKTVNPQASQPQTKEVKEQTSSNSGKDSVHPMKNNLWWLWLIIGLIVGVGLTTTYFTFLK